MPAAAQTPLLFLDVDGTLIPFGAPLRSDATANAAGQLRPDLGNPLLARLNPEHGPRLSTLACDLVWATTWMADANSVIAPLLGLPALPVVEWPDADEAGPIHWKTRTLVNWAAGRPFVWVDDEIAADDRAWVAAHHPEPALLQRVNPCQGLTDSDFSVIADWVVQL